jgi:hypothetical protein
MPDYTGAAMFVPQIMFQRFLPNEVSDVMKIFQAENRRYLRQYRKRRSPFARFLTAPVKLQFLRQ